MTLLTALATHACVYMHCMHVVSYHGQPTQSLSAKIMVTVINTLTHAVVSLGCLVSKQENKHDEKGWVHVRTYRGCEVRVERELV